MTDKRTTWVDGDVLYADDLSDSILMDKFIEITNAFANLSITGAIAHSSTTYSAIASTGEITQTSDSGVTWTSRSTVNDTFSFIRLCRGTNANGVAIERGATTQEVTVTTNSGATWTAATSIGFTTDIFDVSYPVSGMIAVGGDDDAGAKHVVFSTDGGTTWTDATTAPSAAIFGIDMLDATTGYALDSGGNIWKTTDGAVTWTDTTHDLPSGTADEASVYAVSSTLVLIATDRLFLYNNGTGAFTLVTRGIFTTNWGFTELTNGDIFVAGSHATGGKLLRSSDNGTTWSQADVGAILIADNEVNKCLLTSYSNILLMGGAGNASLLRIYVPD